MKNIHTNINIATYNLGEKYTFQLHNIMTVTNQGIKTTANSDQYVTNPFGYERKHVSVETNATHHCKRSIGNVYTISWIIGVRYVPFIHL